MDRSFRFIHRLLAMTGIGVLFLPLLWLLLPDGMLPWKLPLLSGVVFLLIAAGYGLQALVALLLGFRRIGDNAVERPFSMRVAGLAVFLSLGAGAAGYPLLRRLFLFSVDAGLLDLRYDPNSLLPYLAAVSVGVLLIVGVVLWFFSPYRIITVNVLIVVIPALIAELLITRNTGLMILVLAVFSLCAAVTLNQGVLTRTVFDSVADVTPRQKLYNTGMTLAVLLCVTPVLFISAASVVVGGAFLLQLLGYFVLRLLVGGGVPKEEELLPPGEDAPATDFLARLDVGGSPLTGALVALFFVLLLAGMLFLILRGRVQGGNVREHLRAFLRRIFALFLRKYRPTEQVRTVENNYYLDEEVRLQRPDAVRADREGCEQPLTYRAFYRALIRCPDAGAQLRYAYRTMCGIYARRYALRASDTPHEIRDKLTAQRVGADLTYVTERCERLCYAKEAPPAPELERALAQLCEDIRARLPD